MDAKILPAFKGNNNCIVFSSNEEFAPVASVAIRSLLESGSRENTYDIILIHTDISRETADSLEKMTAPYENASLRLVDIGDTVRSGKYYTGNRQQFSKEAYYRLYIPFILDESYEKALYFDADMLFYRDVEELFSTSVSDELIAAVRDYWGICQCYMPWKNVRSYRERIGLTDIDDYVISSTVLFFLDNIRKDGFDAGDIKRLISRRKWRQHDQDVLNILCKGRIRYISPKWGMIKEHQDNFKYLPETLLKEITSALDDIAVYHFAAYRKPWRGFHGEESGDFWKCAAGTPFFPDILKMINKSELLNEVVYEITNRKIPTADGIKVTEDEKTGERYYGDICLGKYGEGYTRYRVIRIENGFLHLEGMLGFFGVSGDAPVKTEIYLNDTPYPVKEQEDENGTDRTGEITRYRGVSFSADIPVKDIRSVSPGMISITIRCLLDGREVIKDKPGFDRYAPLVGEHKHSYCCIKDYIITSDENGLCLYKNTFIRRFLFERRYIACNFFRPKAPYLRAIFGRKAAHILRAFKTKPIWLVNDRRLKADDNGEAFFEYLCAHNDRKDKDIIFVIDKRSPDCERLRKVGKVVDAGSGRHKLLLARADVVVSSQTDMIFRYPFIWKARLYRDLLSDVRFVFLQHGVLEKDASAWLERKNQELRGMVTSAPKERDMILNGKYHYSPDEIWLTGLPRFDRLKDRSEKLITVIPTWRRYLSRGRNNKTGIWEIIPGFSDSEYVRFYRELERHPRLREKLDEYGYKLMFKIHPSFLGYESEFGFKDDSRWWDNDLSYREIYEKSSLLITDYSSAINDFIYLYKPIVYCQFDIDTFYGGGQIMEKGDFDYEKDGFGEVTYDMESLVDMIVGYMEDDCRLKDVYRKRIDDFFEYHDRNNCQRVYDKICELLEDKE